MAARRPCAIQRRQISRFFRQPGSSGSAGHSYSESFGLTVLVGQQSSLKAVGYADDYSTASVSPLDDAELQDGSSTLVPGSPFGIVFLPSSS